MRRTWLAAILGIILGLGMAVLPSPSILFGRQFQPPLVATQETARPSGNFSQLQGASNTSLQLQWIILGMLAGIIATLPAFCALQQGAYILTIYVLRDP